MCDECYHNHDWTEYKLNAVFSTNYPCILCTQIIDFNSNFCAYCALPMQKEQWNEYAAYILDLGEYNGLTSQAGFNLLEHRVCNKSTGYREKYDSELAVLKTICFLCLKDTFDCDCVYNLSMNKINTLPIPNLSGIYYQLSYSDADESAKRELTCDDCKWQYTSNCKPLSLELLDVDAERYKRDHKVVISNELVTCEYMTKDDSWDDSFSSYF